MTQKVFLQLNCSDLVIWFGILTEIFFYKYLWIHSLYPSQVVVHQPGQFSSQHWSEGQCMLCQIQSILSISPCLWLCRYIIHLNRSIKSFTSRNNRKTFQLILNPFQTTVCTTMTWETLSSPSWFSKATGKQCPTPSLSMEKKLCLRMYTLKILVLFLLSVENACHGNYLYCTLYHDT